MTSDFLREIGEQPETLARLTRYYRDTGRGLLSAWRRQAEERQRIVFAGMGTSLFAAESVLSRMAAQHLDARVRDAGELLHYGGLPRALWVLISQSGESAETRQLAESCAPDQPYVAVTNDPASTVARRAGLHLPLLAGAEAAITTKTYVNTLGLLFLMSQTAARVTEGIERLKQAAATLAAVDRAGIEAAADLLAEARALHFVARGPALAAARQAALTFMEGARLPAAAFTGGEFRHGPFELVDAAHRCVCYVPQGETSGLLAKLAAEVAARGGQVVAITDHELAPLPGRSRTLKVPAHGEDLFSLAAATTQALLLEATARRRGLVAGEFRHGQKVTRVE